jgi:NAD(P)H-dependent FMN reductase
MRLLAISGSLRRASVNTAALEALARLAPEGFVIDVYRGLAALPAFNPDDDEDGAAAPPAVRALRDAVAACDGLVIAAPEYAHGVPGALKNALDWLVASDALPGKPVALINCAPRAFHAEAALRETLATMAARLIPEAFATLPLTVGATVESICADPLSSGRLRDAARAFEDALRS